MPDLAVILAHRFRPGCFLTSIVLTIWSLPAATIRAQPASLPEPVGLVSSTDQAAIDQVSTLVAGGQAEEALLQLDRLRDQRPALVRCGTLQAASTQRLQVYQPLSSWCRRFKQQILATSPQLRRQHQLQWDSLAESALNSLQNSKNASDGRLAAARFCSTTHGPVLTRLLVDILIEQEQSLSASEALEIGFPKLTRIDLSEITAAAPAVALPWYRVWGVVRHNGDLAQQLLSRWDAVVAADEPSLCVDVLTRQLIIAGLDPQLLDLSLVMQWAKVVILRLPPGPDKQRLEATAIDVQQWDDLPLKPSRWRFNLDQQPAWQVELDRIANSSDITPATRPRVGELESTLAYTPVVFHDKVFLHELTAIRAIHLENGSAWPSPLSKHPLYQSRITASDYLPPGYPLQGLPTGRVVVDDDYLYARMGSPVTAWANRSPSSNGSSLSYLIGLDLQTQGKMLSGFPLRIGPPEFESAELEGCPAIFEDRIVAAIVQRDEVGLRRGLAAFDRFSGNLLWRSEVLGSGVVVGSEKANLIANTKPVVAGGLIYYCCDLGTIACLNPLTGQTLWITTYQRSQSRQADHLDPNRFRYRNGNPCIVNQGLVYCLPQDCPELLAVDALSGDLVWSTNEFDVCDATQFVGIVGRSLLVSGDRLVWLDKQQGRVVGRFPSSSTPGPINSLPQPRGLGAATIVGDQVIWPTADEIFVFVADLASADYQQNTPVDSPRMLSRFSTHNSGSEGGNLFHCQNWILIATPNRLLGFEAER